MTHAIREQSHLQATKLYICQRLIKLQKSWFELHKSLHRDISKQLKCINAQVYLLLLPEHVDDSYDK